MKSEGGNTSDSKDNTQQIIIQSSNNYNVTVIPVEYPRNRLYPTQNSDYVVEQYNQYSEFPTRSREDYVQPDDIANTQNTLYSVSQRIPPVTTSYSNLCPEDVRYQSEVNTYPGIQGEWKRERSSEAVKDGNIENLEDKRSNEAAGVSIPNSIAASSTTSSETLGPTIPMCVYLHSRTVIMLDVEDTPSATSELICQAIVNSEELGLNKQLAMQIFSLWIVSPLLELQLRPYHKPYEIRQRWRSLLEQYCHASFNRQQKDEPKLMFQRNVFFSKQNEEKIKDQKILELLYEEARYNILNGRYPCEVPHYIMLGGIQAREELGPYNPQIHSTHYFREEQSKYLPIHVRKSSTWTWLPISSKNSAEVRLLEQFKRIPNTATNRKLMKKYLEFCWSLPFYGAAFFEGQIEQPVRGLTSLMTHQDIPVLVAINARGCYIIDDLEFQILLGVRYEEFSWEYARPSREDNPDSLPCLFIQFLVVENGARVSKILQVFSRQSGLMDTLISAFVAQMKSPKPNDEGDNKAFENQMAADHDSRSTVLGNSYASNYSVLSNKLSKLTLATFDEDGHCIGQMGSWSFSY